MAALIAGWRRIFYKAIRVAAWYGPRAFACLLVRGGWTQIGLSAWRFANRASPDMQHSIFRLLSVAAWAENHGKDVITISPARTISLQPVYRYGPHLHRKDMHAHTHEVHFPAVTLTTLKDAFVLGGSEMVMTDDGALLYDELALGNRNRYGVKAWGNIPALPFGRHLPAATRNKVLVSYWHSKRIPPLHRAISFTKDHSRNYYHWMLECLPRALVALKRPEFADYPLLVDEDLPPQLLESLRLVSQNREIIHVMKGMAIQVKELILPSVFSYTHDFYGRDACIEDLLISPDAVKLVRETLLPKMHDKKVLDKRELRDELPRTVNRHKKITDINENERFIYLARSGGTHRAITNEPELIEMVKRLGFKVVYPGKLNLMEQIALFSQAEMIVGPTGAGMTNIIFAPAQCKIIVLAGATTQANYYIFAQLAQYLGQTFSYVTGRVENPSDLHSNYYIHPPTLRYSIEENILAGGDFA